VKAKPAPAPVRRTHFKVIPLAAVVRLTSGSRSGAHPGAPEKRKGPKRGSRVRS